MHLNYDDRLEIEKGLKLKYSITYIANKLGKTYNAIKSEILTNSIKSYPSDFNSKRNQCLHFHNKDCKIHNICNDNCIDKHCYQCRKGKSCNDICKYYEEYTCPTILKKPFCCNSCDNYKACRKIRVVYDAKKANQKYEERLSKSRTGPRATKEEIDYINNVVAPRIKNGQSFGNIKLYDKNITKSTSTLYNYTQKGYFDNLNNLDLPKKVKYKIRKKDNKKEEINNDISLLKITRSYQSFIQFISEHSDFNITEMDTVYGKKNDDSSKTILTFLFRKSNFMIAILLPNRMAKTIEKEISKLKTTLGFDFFYILFRILLTDNGKEFYLIEEIESLKILNKDEKINIFFCDSGKSNQKAKIEKNHVEFRKIFPKGTSFEKFVQSDINLAMSNINSYKRKTLNGLSPIECLINEFGEEFTLNLLKLLNYKIIKDEDIILSPKLFKK